jgi:hypothetical protein
MVLKRFDLEHHIALPGARPTDKFERAVRSTAISLGLAERRVIEVLRDDDRAIPPGLPNEWVVPDEYREGLAQIDAHLRDKQLP